MENKVEISICYVNMLSDILNIQKRNNYELLRENGYENEYLDGDLQNWIDEILENFCKPLIKYDKDTEIILHNEIE